VSDVDVAVVGGGLVGCAIARGLARNGLRVVVLERGEPGREASHAAAGMLSPQAEAEEAGPFLDLLRAARNRFPEVAATLRAETGVDIGYDTRGTLFLAFTDADEREIEQRHRWQSAAGLPVEWLGRAAALALEPALSSSVRAALRFPDDHQAENRNLAHAYAVAAARAGAEIRCATHVSAVQRDGPRVRVDLGDGDALVAGCVVVAAGAWSGGLTGLPRTLPVEPVHGQLAALHAVPLPFAHVVDSPRAYLVPRAGAGRVIVGATVERTGFARAVTPAGLMQILGGALEICPALGALPLAETWSGLRPGTPDGMPILGPDPDWPQLVYATGHYRNGVLLAPLTADLIVETILSGRTAAPLLPFGIARFA
jgi:glycine oxidase